jgi:hypothetical protein
MGYNEITQLTERAEANWRERVSAAVPYVVAILGFFWMWDEVGLLERIGMSVFAGVIFTPLLYFAVLVAVNRFSRLQGRPSRDVDWKDSGMRGVAVLMMIVWFLARWDVWTTEHKMVHCLSQRAATVDYSGSQEKMGDIVDYCSTQLHESYDYHEDH